MWVDEYTYMLVDTYMCIYKHVGSWIHIYVNVYIWLNLYTCAQNDTMWVAGYMCVDGYIWGQRDIYVGQWINWKHIWVDAYIFG